MEKLEAFLGNRLSAIALFRLLKVPMKQAVRLELQLLFSTSSMQVPVVSNLLPVKPVTIEFRNGLRK